MRDCSISEIYFVTLVYNYLKCFLVLHYNAYCYRTFQGLFSSCIAQHLPFPEIFIYQAQPTSVKQVRLESCKLIKPITWLNLLMSVFLFPVSDKLAGQTSPRSANIIVNSIPIITANYQFWAFHHLLFSSRPGRLPAYLLPERKLRHS